VNTTNSAISPGGNSVYIDPAGKVTYVHSGEYASQGTIDADIQQYANHG
jgi:hypothetical protein